MAMQPRDIVIRVGVGEVYAMVVAEGSSWNPDVARDMVGRLNDVWRETIETAVDVGLIDTSPLPREIEDDDFLDEELDEIFSDKEVGEDGTWR